MTPKRKRVWVRVDYHFRSSFLYKTPLCNPQSARLMLTPDRATVRNALNDRSMDLYGEADTREYIFPLIRTAKIMIRPPEMLGVSPQTVSMLKPNPKIQGAGSFVQASGFQEMALCHGPLTIYLQVYAGQDEALFRQLLLLITYWGKAESLVYGVLVDDKTKPNLKECVLTLAEVERLRLRPQPLCYQGVFRDYRDDQVTWKEVMYGGTRTGETQGYKLTTAVWPMAKIEQRGSSVRWERRSFESV